VVFREFLTKIKVLQQNVDLEFDSTKPKIGKTNSKEFCSICHKSSIKFTSICENYVEAGSRPL
jgi:hypothetical protein